MILKLDLDSEKVAASGSVIAPGVMRVLGQPNMDALAVLVREAVQNSWDARLERQGGVAFSVAGWTLDRGQRKLLRKQVFAACPEMSVPSLPKHLQSSNPFHILAFHDRGTLGLGGPTRADVVVDQGKANDFVDFLRNVGQPPDRQLAGGTYGYGKAAFYRASRVRTICVYSRCMYRGRHETRFLAAALGEPFQTASGRFTGRHWWGHVQRGVAEPILDDSADMLAQGLGIPPFAPHETGTTVLVLQPAFNPEHVDKAGASDNGRERTPKQALNLMIEQILLYFWPKMLAYGSGQPAIQFAASWNGEPLAVPRPEEFAPLKGFMAAMQRLKGQELSQSTPFRHLVKEVKSQRPARLLGKLALQQYQVEPYAPFDTGEKQSAFVGLTHQTALMRQPELVVRYLSGDPYPDAAWGYAGVFITDSDVDPVFAAAEPPAHDDWVSKGLEDNRHRRYVNVALREIEGTMAEFVVPPNVSSPNSELIALAAFADRLGQSLLPVETGPSAAVQGFGGMSHGTFKRIDDSTAPSETPGQPAGTNALDAVTNRSIPSPTGRSRVQVVDERFSVVDNQPAVEIRFAVHHARGARTTAVQAHVGVVIDGAQVENEPPVGGDLPRVLLWRPPNGGEQRSQGAVLVSADDTAEWTVVVSLPRDLMIDVDLKAESSL